jgi:uncharacterized protein YbaP (TraB family)
MNAEESDAGLAEALITRRNKAWAQWLKQRLDKPGRCSSRVGAGHLAGPAASRTSSPRSASSPSGLQ